MCAIYIKHVKIKAGIFSNKEKMGLQEIAKINCNASENYINEQAN
jgi:hypothetical protein